MVWAPKFDSAWARAWLIRTVCVALVFGIFGTAVGERPKNEPGSRDRGRGLALATTPSRAVMRVNRVIMLFTDVGEIGSSGSSVAGGGFWKAESNQYIFSSGVNVGAKLADGTIVFANGGPFSELSPGSSRFPGVFRNDANQGLYWDSKDENDRANYPEVCTVDQPRIDRFPTLESFAGEPFPGFADQTLCIAVNDYLGGACGECAGTRVGITVVETIFAFGVPTVQDFVFAQFRVYNDTQFINATNSPLQPPGPYTLNEVIFSFAGDFDIGEAGDDQITFLPDIQTMAFWDSDFNEPQFQGPLGIGGVGLVVLPIDPATGAEIPLAEFTLFTNGAPRPDPPTKEVWYALQEGRNPGPGGDTGAVLTVPPNDVRGMVSTAKFTLAPDQFVEMGAAYFFAEIPVSPPAELLGEAYKVQTPPGPGGALIPGANRHPAFNLLRQQALVAAASANAGFFQPLAPPSPDFVQIPGDRQITIVWDAAPVTASNPFGRVVRAPFALDPEDAVLTGILLGPGDLVFFGGLFQTAAQAGLTGAEVTNADFNPDFVVFDFEGFRVYRSRTGLAEDAELIAQFDLGNNIAGGQFCIAAVAVTDADGNFIRNVCTEEATLAGPNPAGGNDPDRSGSNTGLLFSVVDRGGSFPDPANGPGLINGIPVAHAVTSFGVNCGLRVPELAIPAGSETIPAAACLVLESGKVFTLATPESDPSSFRSADVAFIPLKGDGTDCNPNEAAYTVDSATGKFTDLLDCSNAIVATLAANRAGNIPTGEFFFVIDKITSRCENPVGTPSIPPNCYQLAPGDVVNIVHWHWEKAGGAAATEIIPSSGTFDQHFGFFHTSLARLGFGFDTDLTDVGNDLDIALVINSSFSNAEDLEINGQSVHLGELGGTHTVTGLACNPCEARPHAISNSSAADLIVIGAVRSVAAAREYSHPSYYSTGASSFELTWEVSGSTFNGTMRRLPGGQVVPKGGQVLGPDNPSTVADFIPGYNWCIIAGTAATVRPAFSPARAGPCPPNNDVTLAVGSSTTPNATMGIYVPGQSVYLEGLKVLPANGDKWIIRVEGASRRGAPDPNGGVSGREPNTTTGPFRFVDNNDGGDALTSRQIVNVFPGARWKLNLSGGSNELADADLNAISVAPNPFIAINEVMQGRGRQTILFNNLPPVATIRIYTISGNLVRTLEHTDGSGTENFDVRTKFDLLFATGNYYYHVTTPDGRTHIGRFAVVN